MKKILRLLIFFCVTIFAKELAPLKQIDIHAAVLDIAVGYGKIAIATDASKVIVLDENLSLKKEIRVRKIKDFMGTLNDADIYSVDMIDDRIMFLAQVEEGYSELYIWEHGQAKKVLDKSKMLYAKAAKLVDKNHAVLVLMSDEAVLYDIQKRSIIQRVKAGEYFYSVMAMDRSRDHFVIGDEGGEVIVMNAKNLQRVKLIKNVNKDKILSIDINGNFIVAGSRADKTLALYNWKSGTHKVIKNPDFFIYVVGLSPDNRYVVYGDNDKYILKILRRENLDLKYLLKGHKNIVNVARFIDNKELITGSETGEIIKWRLP